MKWYRLNGRVLTLMLALAFFNFIFLGIEYQFDNMMALVTGPEQVVTAQGYILGASVLGFLLYPAAASCIKEKFWQIVVFAGALAGVILAWQEAQYIIICPERQLLNIWRRPSVYHMQLASFSSFLIIIL